MFRLIFTFSFTPKLISRRRIYDAVDVMLSMQNSNGGFASYELIRGPDWLEWLNPAEVFGKCQRKRFCSHDAEMQCYIGDIMIEHSYPECTTSVITALATFRKHYSDYRSADLECVSYIPQTPDSNC